MKEGTTQSAFSLDNLGLLASMKHLGLLKVAFNHSLKIFLGLKLAKEDFPIGQHGKNFVGEEVNSLSLSLSLFLTLSLSLTPTQALKHSQPSPPTYLHPCFKEILLETILDVKRNVKTRAQKEIKYFLHHRSIFFHPKKPTLLITH